MVEAPSKDTDAATGGTTESGISGAAGTSVFAALHQGREFDKRVSVSVDFLASLAPIETASRSPLRMLQTGPGTADQAVPGDKETRRPGGLQRPPARQRLNSEFAPPPKAPAGSDVIIERNHIEGNRALEESINRRTPR